ncbi:MAG: single-stranded-DNA-specific exonuclease RecJ [Clostridiaceae bacterium]|nr:single-stranded-DNA-specific exonuclease RecJ [Clostridiaceae bacterium]
MFEIKENVLEKRKWYPNPLTQVYNETLLKDKKLSSLEKIDLGIKALLEAKGLNDEVKQNEFLEPDFVQMHDPFLFKDMYLTCEIIAQSLDKREKILIYGDYDCDGITSTAILVRLLQELGADVSYFIPNRLDDGYGLSEDTVQEVIALKPNLVITVDCGINNYAEINTLMQANIKVIISDHHQPAGDYMKNALAVINPQVATDNYPFAELAGAGVAYKIAEALVNYLQVEEIDLSPALCLAAIGTVADSMPLEEENRAIVALGTRIFKDKAPLGLRTMAKNFNTSNSIEASFFSFVLGPRINAAGRMGDIEPALDLLLSDDISVVEKSIERLEELNNRRKDLERKIYEEAITKIDAMPKSEKENIILVADYDWHEGIIGIVSSRLMERFSVPVITFSGSEGELKGSARSLGNFDILAAITSAEEHTISYGGHLQAAGVTVAKEKFELFKKTVIDYARANPVKKSEISDRQYSLELPHELICDEFAERLTSLEPFGQKNEKPTFVLKNVYIDQWREVGQGKHISLDLRLSDLRIVSGIAFNAQEFSRIFKQNDSVDLLLYLNWREWNGQYKMQLQVLDMAVPTLNSLIWDDVERLENTYQIEINQINNLEKMYGINRNQFSVTNEQITNVTKYIYQYSPELGKGFNIAVLARAIVREMQLFLNPFILLRILDMLSEILILEIQVSDSYNCKINLLPKSEGNLSIQESQTWRNLNEQGYIIHE